VTALLLATGQPKVSLASVKTPGPHLHSPRAGSVGAGRTVAAKRSRPGRVGPAAPRDRRARLRCMAMGGLARSRPPAAHA